MTDRKLTNGENWASLILGHFSEVEGAGPLSGVVLLNGRMVDSGEVTGGYDCLSLTVGADTYKFTTTALSEAGVTAKGYPLVQSDKGDVSLRFLTDSANTFNEIVQAMYD
jgi:hypothetical protein